ncbi:MAG: hypothetical protein JXA00_03410 [Candidatus Thermoplasmatota archaeon]|nr:hypothetical protein [Candidatus Thermoplasmatota archaeon]
MKTIKGMLAVGVILLFFGLALSPATARTTIKEKIEVGIIGDLPALTLSENDLSTLERFLPALFEKMQSATSQTEVIDALHALMKEYGRHPVLVFLMNLLIKLIRLNFNVNQLRPLRKTAFVMSLGFTSKYLALGKNKISISKPLTSWLYTGRSNLVLNSRTLVLDLHPFTSRMISGRQIGVMTNFIGLYIHFHGSITDKAKTFFVGYAGAIRGFDLSPIHC